MVATLTSKGQITLPIGLRKQLGLRAGDRVDFQTGSDGTVSVHALKGGIASLAGIAKPVDGRRRSLLEMDRAIAKGRAKAKA